MGGIVSESTCIATAHKEQVSDASMMRSDFIATVEKRQIESIRVDSAIP
jgi:hypothetical protein